MEKNVAGKWTVFAYGAPSHATLAGLPVTGDAANITANIRIDGGAANAVDDSNPTELEDGLYIFDITAVENNGDQLTLAPASSTSNVIVIGVPGSLYTRPPNFNALSVESDGDLTKVNTLDGHTPQTADHTAGIAAIPTTAMRGTDGALTDKTGFSLSTAGILAIWDQLTSALTTASTIGRLLVDNINATISSRASQTSVDDVPTNSEFNARTLATADYFDPTTDAVANVSLTDVTTTLTNKTGFSLAATGLDAIVSTATGMVAIAKAIWDAVLIGGNFNIPNSAGRRIRQIQEAGSYNGRVWINTGTAGSPGTTPFENGTDTSQVDNMPDANTLSADPALGLSIFEVAPGSSITFTTTQANQFFLGELWNLTTSVSQSISGSSICGADVTGVFTGATPPRFERCSFGATTTVPPCRINGGSTFKGILTFGSAGQFDILNCSSLFSGPGAPTFDMGLGLGASNLNIKGWEGGIEVINIEAGDVVTIQGEGGVITLDGTGGTVNIRGIFEDVVDNSGAAVIIDQTAMLNRRSLNVYPMGVVIDTTSANTGIVAYNDGTFDIPAGSLDNARDIAALIGDTGINEFDVLRGSTIVLDAAFSGTNFNSRGGVMDLSDEDISSCSFNQMFIIGNGVGSSPFFFNESALSGNSLDQFTATLCTFAGTVTLTSPAEYKMLRGCSSSSITADPVINFGAVGNQLLHINGWGGNIVFDNVGNTGTDVVNISGQGKITINASCVPGGTINIFGMGFEIINNGTAVVNRIPNVDTLDSILGNTETRLPAALQNGRMQSNVDAIADSNTSALNLRRSTEAITRGKAVAGTLSSTQMSTDLTEVTPNHFERGLLIWTTGELARMGGVSITASGATGILTYTETKTGESPSEDDEFVIV